MPSLAATTARKIKARNLASGTVTDPLAIDDDDEPALNAEAGPSSPMNPIKRGKSYQCPLTSRRLLIRADTPPLGDDEFPQSLMKVEHTKYYGASRDPRVSISLRIPSAQLTLAVATTFPAVPARRTASLVAAPSGK